MTKIKSIFWNKGVSPKAIQLLKLGKDIDGNYRSIQPVNSQFNLGTNPQITRFAFISTDKDLVSFLSSTTGDRDSFRGFKLLILNDENENFYLQLNYRVILWQLLDSSKKLRKAMGLKQSPTTPDGLNLKALNQSVKAVKLLKTLELNLNSFIIEDDLYMPIQAIDREATGKWKEVHTPIKW